MKLWKLCIIGRKSILFPWIFERNEINHKLNNKTSRKNLFRNVCFCFIIIIIVYQLISNIKTWEIYSQVCATFVLSFVKVHFDRMFCSMFILFFLKIRNSFIASHHYKYFMPLDIIATNYIAHTTMRKRNDDEKAYIANWHVHLFSVQTDIKLEVKSLCENHSNESKWKFTHEINIIFYWRNKYFFLSIDTI